MRDTEAEQVGKRLHAEGLVGGNFGNLSVRAGTGFYIKRKNAYLDAPGPLIFVPFEGPVPDEASREAPVHREIYRATPAEAIVHAHPPYAIVLSYLRTEVNLQGGGEEGTFCPRIPVVEGAPGTSALARSVADALRTSPAVIVRGHGTFATGATLADAGNLTSAMEHACRILFLRRLVEPKGG